MSMRLAARSGWGQIGVWLIVAGCSGAPAHTGGDDAGGPEAPVSPAPSDAGLGEGIDAQAGPSDAGAHDATLVSSGGSLSDAAPNDGSIDVDVDAAPACATAGTELCDDFESGDLNAKIWTTTKLANDTVTVETGRAHSGNYAVHVKMVAGQHNNAQIAEAVTFPAKDNAFYTRAYAYFAPDIPSGTGYHMGYIVASGNNDLGKVQAGLGSIGPKDFLGYSIYFGPPSYEFGPWDSLTVAANQWLCLELFEAGTPGTGETRRIWVNGNELTHLSTTYDGQAPPQFNLVSLGVWQYDGNTPTLSDMWIDDVRVSSQRIGCDP